MKTPTITFYATPWHSVCSDNYLGQEKS